jgi:hypothetical protein
VTGIQPVPDPRNGGACSQRTAAPVQSDCFALLERYRGFLAKVRRAISLHSVFPLKDSDRYRQRETHIRTVLIDVAGSHDLAGVSCPRTMRHVSPGPGAGVSHQPIAVQAAARLSRDRRVAGPAGPRIRSRPARGRSSSRIDPAARPASQRTGGLTASSTGSAIRRS